MSRVDDVFSPEAPGLPGGARPPVDRLRRARVLLAIALPLNLFGIVCFTGVVGAVLALVGWQLADEEIARAESGAAPKDQLGRARQQRDFAFGQLLFAILSLLAQVILFGMGFYDLLAGAVIGVVQALWPF